MPTFVAGVLATLAVAVLLLCRGSARADSPVTDRMVRWWAAVWLRAAAARVTVHDLEHVRPAAAYVVAGRLVKLAVARGVGGWGRSVGSVQTTVNRVIQLLHHRTLEPHQTFGNGETLLVRSRVPAYLTGRRVAEFNVPGEIGVVELSRAGHSKIPEPSTPLEDGDVLSFIVAAASLGRPFTGRPR